MWNISNKTPKSAGKFDLFFMLHINDTMLQLYDCGFWIAAHNSNILCYSDDFCALKTFIDVEYRYCTFMLQYAKYVDKELMMLFQ